MQKNIMTTVPESLHAALMKQANNEGISLREYLRKVLQNDVKQHQIAKQADKVLLNSDAQLNDPLFAMNISPETAYRKLNASDWYKRSDIDLIVANLLIKQQQLVMQRITTVGQPVDPKIDDLRESFLNKLQTKAKFSSRPWDPVAVLYDQHGEAISKEDFAKEVMFDEPDQAIHTKLVDALAIIRCYYGIDEINHGQISMTLAMIDDDDTKYRQGERPYVNLLASVNAKAWHEIQQTVQSAC